jgi:hypothetical protein
LFEFLKKAEKNSAEKPEQLTPQWLAKQSVLLQQNQSAISKDRARNNFLFLREAGH